MNIHHFRTTGRMAMLLLVCTGTFACASKPIIDSRGVDMVQYQADLEDCVLVAEQVQTGQQIAKSSAAGAAAGAAIGIVTAVITGDASDIAYSSAYGAVGGGTAGAFNADEEKARVVRNCLRNRGYVVLN